MSDEQTPAPVSPPESDAAQPGIPKPGMAKPGIPKPGMPKPSTLKPSGLKPGPRPGGAPNPAAHAGAAPAVADPARLAEAMSFGRVADDGTVFVRRSDGEHEVGSYPDAPVEEALAYFARKFEEVATQIDLFEQRVASTDVPAAEIEAGVAKLRDVVRDVHAVGDLDALGARVEAMAPLAAERRAQAEAARGAAREEARARRLTLVEEAEQIAGVPAERTQWRADGQRMKDLFEIWRAEQRTGARGAGAREIPTVRLDRRSEDELWKRFSHARTAFDRKRRQHFAHLDEQHEEAKLAKEKLVKEAEALRDSKDWGPTAAAFKKLMDRWRAAGRASRKEDDELWARFRAAQDAFFTARHAVQKEQDDEFSANLAVKEKLLADAERLVPVTDLAEAKARLRDIQDKWEAAGKVPRADMDRIERRMRAVEQTVRADEDARWRNTNPEARARAQNAVDQLETAIADLEADLSRARDQGKAKRVAEAEAALTARRQWLEQARGALRDFGG